MLDERGIYEKEGNARRGRVVLPANTGDVVTRIYRDATDKTPFGYSWLERWGGPDGGLVCSWLRGIQKAQELPSLSEAARRGELPPLAWKGGSDKPLKAGRRFGSMHYLATWQGLRGEDLDIDTGVPISLVCTRFQTQVTFADDAQTLALLTSEDS